MNHISFKTHLATAFLNGPLASDDLVAFLLPLAEEILDFHEQGLVCPFGQMNAFFLTEGRLDVDEHRAHAPRLNEAAVAALQPESNVSVTGRTHQLWTEGGVQQYNLEVQTNLEQQPAHPVYLPHFLCYEQLLGHHDALTDLFCFGMMMGCMGMALNGFDVNDLPLFAEARRQPRQRNPRLHPALAALITELTELDCRQRPADMYEVVRRLTHYREWQPAEEAEMLAPGRQRQQLLQRLRNRLFDLSRRNRLLYYKPNSRFVNCTWGSVPMVMQLESIRPEMLFTWNGELARKICKGQEITLNQYLRFEDHPYLPAQLDKLRLEARRSGQEYGFNPLRLVLLFLNWQNTKENGNEVIQSPLLLLPAELKKQKRIQEEQFTLTPTDTVAEVNPVLVHQLRELYNIALPATVELSTEGIETFVQQLQEQVAKAAQGLKLIYVNRPRIKLIYNSARQAVNQYRKKKGLGRLSQGHYRQLAHSYLPNDYRPMGLAVFEHRLRPGHPVPEWLRTQEKLDDAGPVVEHWQSGLKAEFGNVEANAQQWEVDACQLVLGNFHYKKMSLVQDYAQLEEEGMEHTVFQQLFNPQPRQTEAAEHGNTWTHVIEADPTQAAAVAQGRKGNSYIIQGPPGTGKSQTITNLIADYVSQGKQVLFVCEKRAALDVVVARLAQCGLDDLCCYVHDSQSDKKTFIGQLKASYEAYLNKPSGFEDIERRRNQLLTLIEQRLGVLNEFRLAQLQELAPGLDAQGLLARLAHLAVPLEAVQAYLNKVQPYAQWLTHKALLLQLYERLGFQQITHWGAHPLSKINPSAAVDAGGSAGFSQSIESLANAATELQSSVLQLGLQGPWSKETKAIHQLCEQARQIEPLARQGLLGLLLPGSEAAAGLVTDQDRLATAEQATAKAWETAAGWQQPLSPSEAVMALQLAKDKEPSFFKFLNGQWRRLKSVVHQQYQFGRHSIAPTVTQTLEWLVAAQQADAQLVELKQQLSRQYHGQPLDQLSLRVELLRRKMNAEPGLQMLVRHPQAEQLVDRLIALEPAATAVFSEAEHIFLHPPEMLPALTEALNALRAQSSLLHQWLPLLQDLAKLPTSLQAQLADVPLSATEMEAAMAWQSLQQWLHSHPQAEGMDVAAIAHQSQQLLHHYRDLLAINARWVAAGVHQRFAQRHQQMELAPARDAGRKSWMEGRKLLENEFAKQIRFKSIRDLCARESGELLRLLKPVWLMSPLSVSDSLPLSTDFFDVVIFDEASQITLEEGVPALFRAGQTIIVGDEKQMPPTRFFASAAHDPDDEDVPADAEQEEAQMTMDAESLLAQGSRQLPNTLLSWHYRSRSEALISYSNHAFYEGRLLTIPDRQMSHQQRPAISISQPADAVDQLPTLYDRPISFHHLPASVYEKRRNPAEAAYIARMVRQLLIENRPDTIAVVAFSQEQQACIEEAMDALAEADDHFAGLLEAARTRMEGEQFVGLIVKNLENIQGDERDLVIMSVCYGPDANRKTLMNFGPVNKRGGEKRLNVLFSRAKRHMAVVSSLLPAQITNVYNPGANYLRRFLQYAQAVSEGQMGQADGLLHAFAVAANRPAVAASGQAGEVAVAVGQWLQSMGHEVSWQVGQSGFRCSLAVQGKEAYALGILVDDAPYHEAANLLEQYAQKPALLSRHGWPLMRVWALDWVRRPAQVKAAIKQALTDNS